MHDVDPVSVYPVISCSSINGEWMLVVSSIGASAAL